MIMETDKKIIRSFRNLMVRRDLSKTLPPANPAKSSHEPHCAHFEFHGSRSRNRAAGSFRSMEKPLGGTGQELPDGMSGTEGLLFLMLTVYGDDARIFEAICAGACGYLLKNTPPARLLESLTDVMAGGAPMSPEVARRVIELFREIRPPENAEYRLTPHETRLLQLLVDGHNYKTAAAEVGTGVHAVSFHMRNIYEKLQVHSRAEAVAKALRHGIVR
jgi:DNA-binding CsgD family transcriptional regulator